MDNLPLFYNVRDKWCLVVGGGGIAARKAGLLMRAGARVRLVSPQVQTSLAERILAGGGAVHQRNFDATDLDGAVLAVAATDQEDVNRQVSQLAHTRHLPVNVVDSPALCSFILPSIIDRSPIVIGVSSGGASPVLARMIRARLETLIPASYGRLASLVGAVRDEVKARFPDLNQRRGFWESVLSGPVAESVFSGREAEAERLLQDMVQQADPSAWHRGEVYLVGAGPGDPDLLTFRALRLMQQADVVLYDRLVSPDVLDLVRRDADMIYVGKKRSEHAVPQDQINQYLVDLAKEGHRVCRLKGGDPFIFGRGGEELDKLFANNIPFQVVPGITAASGCASYAGIPLTHRDFAQSVRFVTGHLKDNSLNLDWTNLAAEQQTLVFYMGLVGLPVICEQLISHGMDPAMPAALVQQGTTRHQKVFAGTLSSLPDLVAAHDINPPTLIIIGRVVSLQEKLNWFTP